MKCTIPEISWHNRDPVLSIDFQPQKDNENFYRLASGGTDSHVLIWRVYIDEEENTTIEFVSDLTRHQKAVNAVRFSPNGSYLASADDESAIIIWRQKQDTEAPELPDGDKDSSCKEEWTVVRTLRGHLEDVYDLGWSPDSNFMVSGSVDNTAIVWDVNKGTKLGILDSHKGFVQGVAWDPRGQYLATLSSDRKMRVYNAQTRKLVSQVGKSLLPVPKGHKLEGKQVNLFHDDTIQSFFRRLCFSPDGQMLIAPSGVIESQEQGQGQKSSSTTLVFGRNLLNRPVMYLPSLDEYSTCVKCCPVLFELRNLDPSTRPESMFLLPYRVVFAVATACAIVLYDTQQPMPFGYISNLHYARLTDLAWSSDGDMLMVSSTDGYCSVITFSEGELGVPYKEKRAPEEEKSATANADVPISPAKEQSPAPAETENASANKVSNVAPKISPKKEIVEENDVVEIDLCESNDGTMAPPTEMADKVSVENAKNESMAVDPEATKLSTEKASASEENKTLRKDDIKPIRDVKESAVPEKEDAQSTTDLQNEVQTKLMVSEKVVTPVDSGKKARRVQLITLSSPKSKKKL